MAEAAAEKPPSLAEEWSLPVERPAQNESTVDISPVENQKDATSEEAATETSETALTPDKADESPVTENTAETPAAENTNEVSSVEKADEETVTEQSAETPENEQSEEQEADEDKPAIKIETAPADFRFPTTNQTRHCFTRYIEYHRCIQAKGEGAPECDKFAKYYRSLCPTEWVERWNEQRENGTFPGPL